MKSTIIFTGQVRESIKFIESLRDSVRLKKEGLVDQIIFSTWSNELNDYPDIKKFIAMNPILLVEKPLPKNPGIDSTYFQIKCLEHGMNAIKNKNSFVLRNRPDIAICYPFLKKLFLNKEKKLKITRHLSKGDVFKYKIWVPSYEIKIPFYIADICFYGYYDDIRKLAVYKDYDLNINKISHIKRYVDPFIKKYPNALIKKNILPGVENFKLFSIRIGKFPGFIRKPLKFLLWKYNALKLRSLIKNERYLHGLSLYYSILYSHFYVDSLSFYNQIKIRTEYDVKSNVINDKNLESNFKKKFKYKNIVQSYSYSQKLLDNLFSGQMKDNLSRKILKYSKNFILD